MLFELLRALLGWYVARLSTYTVVYGAFSALPVFLLWLALWWMALLAGALLAANLRFWDQPGEPHLSRSPAERFDDVHGVLRAMCRTLGGERHGALPVRGLAPLLDHDPERAGQAALLLAQLGYVTRFVSLGDLIGAGDAESIWAERWAWADDPRTMTPRALFEAIWQEGRPAPDTGAAFPAAFLDQPLIGDAQC